MKEFEKTKAQMEEELSDVRKGGDISLSRTMMPSLTTGVCVCQIKNAMEAAEKQHRETLNEMELKFFKEKVTSKGRRESDQPGDEQWREITVALFQI